MSSLVPAHQHPLLYAIFARVWLHELSRTERARVTLASVPDAALDRLAALGVDYVYLMGVWTLGEEGPRISRTHPDLRAEYDRVLPDWTEADVVGSPFAIARYEVSPAFGGDAGLADLRRRLAARGIGLLLDYVPNHVARDHHWVKERPACFIADDDGAPLCGRDPYLPPWPDTAQLDLRLAETRAVSIEALRSIAARCDGVRCDMAMLVLDDDFRRTWSKRPPAPGQAQASGEFWAEAIDAVRRDHPGFVFVAEAAWDLEWRLQMLGFDYTFDRSLYDRLSHASASSVRGHLGATPDYQRRSIRFIEHHDEPRIAAVLPPDRRRAAAFIAATVPGMRFIHHGQIEGRTVRASLHLARAAAEPVDEACLAFHERLLAAVRRPILRTGSFATLAPRGPGADAFVSYRWEPLPARGAPRTAAPLVAVVNFAPSRGGCRIPLDVAGVAGRKVLLVDLMTGNEHPRDGDELVDPSRGLGVELPAYGLHLFEIRR
ncbi:alpha-amylase family glycosyl hydrolase [Sorangium sp. So ce1036]|uniref:alpha-amylase family glycosyl hydrolase n=1 Tax=Sorangium sp. So ce1036 TaxID=3133328 RepID=UPI003F065F15